jgi:nitrile hydratase
MDGAHDMGGAKGFGPVVPEPNEPVFHGDWERRAFALTVAMARPGGWNIDMSRFARENRPPEDYLSKSYFQIWLAGLETLMIERGLVTREEIEAGKVLSPPKPGVTPIAPTEVTPAIRRGGPTEREAKRPAMFAVGETVRMKDIHPVTHTRLPQYVRGRLGTSNSITAVTSSPTPTRSARARTRNGSTPCASTGRNCGARMQTQRSASPSTPGNPIWSAK